MQAALLLLALLPTCLHAQEWLRPGADQPTRQAAFLDWYQAQPDPFKVRGWKSTARELWFNESRTLRDGSDPHAGARATAAHMVEQFAQQGQHASNKTDDGGTWSRVSGTWSSVTAGRINCMAMDPFNSSHLYVGTPDGGIWETYNGGLTSWTPKSDFLGAIGVSAIAIDISATNTIYIGTGDADFDGAGIVSDSRSIGVLKSTDYGTTWNVTGLNWVVQSPTKISKILVDRTTSLNVLAATGAGMQRTTNGGTTWTVVQAGNFRDMFQDMSYANIWYAATTNGFYKSTTSGASWVAMGAGLPSVGVTRIAIAGTWADPNYIYAHVVNSSGQTQGIYRSTDAGANFTLRSTTNLALWSGTYNLVLAMSMVDREKIYAGGVELYKSTDGGVTWGPRINPNAVDHHFIRLYGASSLWVCNDQGLYWSSNEGASWTSCNAQLHNFQHYRLGVAQNANHIVASGVQDNGSHYFNSGIWSNALGGDGTGAAVDQVSSGTAYISNYNSISRTTNSGSTWTHNLNSGLSAEPYYWVFPVETSPTTSGTVYCGYTNLFKSTNSGASWSPISAWTSGNWNNVIVKFSIAPSNTNYIYVAKKDSIMRTTNGGTNWSKISAGLSNGGYMYNDVFVHRTDPQTAWVVVSGYNASHKVYRTTNGGGAWTNISTGLPNISINSGVHVPGTTSSIFVAADDGVYFYNGATGTWSPYRINLPRAICTDLTINYTNNTLYTSTYGRGVWSTPIVFGAREIQPDVVATSEASMQVFPNPSQGDWQLHYQLGTAKEGQLRLYNAEGRQLGKWRLKEAKGDFRSDLPDLPAGIYFLRLDAGDVRLSEKLIVE